MTSDWDHERTAENDPDSSDTGDAGDGDLELLDAIEEELDGVERILAGLDEDGD